MVVSVKSKYSNHSFIIVVIVIWSSQMTMHLYCRLCSAPSTASQTRTATYAKADSQLSINNYPKAAKSIRPACCSQLSSAKTCCTPLPTRLKPTDKYPSTSFRHYLVIRSRVKIRWSPSFRSWLGGSTRPHSLRKVKISERNWYCFCTNA